MSCGKKALGCPLVENTEGRIAFFVRFGNPIDVLMQCPRHWCLSQSVGPLCGRAVKASSYAFTSYRRPDAFAEAAQIGRRAVWLRTFGEAWRILRRVV